MKFCVNCGSKLEEGKPFCWNCGTQIIMGENTTIPQDAATHATSEVTPSLHGTETLKPDTETRSPHKVSIHSAIPHAPVPPSYGHSGAVGHAMPGFFSSFLSSPSKAIQDEYVSQGIAVIVLFLSAVSTFLVTYATSWRAITDQAQMMVNYRITGESVAEIRARIMSNFDWGAAFGTTVIHTFIAFFILLSTIYLVMKFRGHIGNIDTGLFFSLAACITVVSTAYTFVASIVMFMSSSWGGFMSGLITISINGHTETLPPMPHNSIMLSALGALLLYLVVKRVFRSSTEDSIIAVAIASVFNWTYQAFSVERIFYALYN